MADSRPNIIFIITDQQRFDTIAALGFDYMETPHLDRLVREGVSFTNCHITAPSCAPARASLFSGYYPHTTGILKNGDRWTRSWVEDLNESGYHCVNVGKMHTSPFGTPLGFHERYVVENKDRYLEGRYYFDEWDKALRAPAASSSSSASFTASGRIMPTAWARSIGSCPRSCTPICSWVISRPGGCATNPGRMDRSFCRSAFPAPIPLTIPRPVLPNSIWTKSCQSSR